MISVIIPVLNDQEQLATTLANLNHASVEIIVVDGGSADRSQEVALQAGVRLSQATAGRGHQLNQGAKLANGDILLFLHADTTLPANFSSQIEQTLAEPGTAAGAFSLSLLGNWWGLPLICWGANLRSRLLQLPYGDQGLFIKRHTFWAVGGFLEQAIMEDYCLVQQLKRRGKVVTLPGKAVSSGRRWDSMGLKATLVNQLILLGFFLGLSTDLLAKFYGRIKHL